MTEVVGGIKEKRSEGQSGQSGQSGPIPARLSIADLRLALPASFLLQVSLCGLSFFLVSVRSCQAGSKAGRPRNVYTVRV